MSLVADLLKDARMDPSFVPAETALDMATLQGARAVLWDDALGSIEVGKRADLTLYDLDTPEWVPSHDIVRNLVYCADGRSVKNVLVDGRVVYIPCRGSLRSARGERLRSGMTPAHAPQGTTMASGKRRRARRAARARGGASLGSPP